MSEGKVRQRRVENKYDNNFSRLANGAECPQCNCQTDTDEVNDRIVTVCNSCGWHKEKQLPPT